MMRDKDKLQVIHITGVKDRAELDSSYKDIKAGTRLFDFLSQMQYAYSAADLVICRAGATSLAEITVLGNAAILIPFPFAVDDHQTKNAIEMVRAGAAMMVEEKGLTGEELAETIKLFYHHRDLLRDMEIKSAALGNIRAATDIVDHCMALL